MSKRSTSPTPRGLNHPLLWLLAGLLTATLIWSLQQNASRNHNSADSLRQFETQLAQQTSKNEQLRLRLEQSQDQLYLEKLQRNELLLSKEGELVLQISDEGYMAPNQNENEEEKSGNWEEWMEVLSL